MPSICISLLCINSLVSSTSCGFCYSLLQGMLLLLFSSFNICYFYYFCSKLHRVQKKKKKENKIKIYIARHQFEICSVSCLVLCFCDIILPLISINVMMARCLFSASNRRKTLAFCINRSALGGMAKNIDIKAILLLCVFAN